MTPLLEAMTKCEGSLRSLLLTYPMDAITEAFNVPETFIRRLLADTHHPLLPYTAVQGEFEAAQGRDTDSHFQPLNTAAKKDDRTWLITELRDGEGPLAMVDTYLDQEIEALGTDHAE